MADTTADTTSFTPETSSSTNKENNNDPLDTAQWTNYLPETFGIRDAVKQSSYRWCVREGCVPFIMIWVMSWINTYLAFMDRLFSSFRFA
jgi:hypothetical protein